MQAGQLTTPTKKTTKPETKLESTDITKNEEQKRQRKRRNCNRRRQVCLQYTYQDNNNDYVFRIDTDGSTSYPTHTKTITTIMCLESMQTVLLTTHIPRQ